jgi:hypothetical protein
MDGFEAAMLCMAAFGIAAGALAWLLDPARLARWAARGAVQLARFASDRAALEMDREEALERIFDDRIVGLPGGGPSFDEIVRQLTEPDEHCQD